MPSCAAAPGATIRRPDPVNLAENDRPLFANAFELTLPPRELTVLHDVEVFGRGPLRKDGEYLPVSFVSPDHLERWKRKRAHWRSAAERMFQTVQEFHEPAIWITDNWSNAYFHWMCDALPRLESVLAERSAEDLTLLLPSKYGRSAFYMDSLRIFGLKKIRILNRFERLRCRELLIPSHIAPTGHHDESIMQSIRQRIRASCSNIEPAKRIYITRRHAPTRRIANEDDLRPVLSKHGFETVIAEQLPWPRQMELLASAKTLLSSHGAGLTNMLAMAAGTQMMEIRAQADDHNNCFFTLAAAVQVDYHYLLAAKQYPEREVHKTNLVVEPEQLDAALTLLLASSSRA